MRHLLRALHALLLILLLAGIPLAWGARGFEVSSPAERAQIPFPRPPEPVELTNPADIALSEIMVRYESGNTVKEGQLAPSPSEKKYLIRAFWAADLEAFIRRDDISPEQEVYAKFKLAFVYSGITSGKEGWKGDAQRALQLYREVMDSLPGIICMEKMFSTSSYGALYAGSRVDKAERLAKSYEYLLGFTDEDIERSAEVTFFNGFCIDREMYLRHIKLPPQERERRVHTAKSLLELGIEGAEDCIQGFLEDTHDPEAAARLLELVEDVAPPEKYAAWKSIQG